MNTNTDITIVNDVNAELKPGMFVTAQLGNEWDTSWSPSAPLLLLHTNAVIFGCNQFTGLYQRSPGVYYVARFVQKHHDRKSHEDESSQPIGIVYCTSAVPVDMQQKSSKHLSANENDILAMALGHHKDKIAKLPVALRYKKDQLIDPSTDF